MNPGQSLELLSQHPDFKYALQVIESLKRAGARTVFAGGCVRDSLLGIRPKDLDLATSALPELVEATFAKTLAVGKAFGTVIAVIDGRNFEVTTFRKDGPYLNGRHPSRVDFVDIEEDAKRRDFTVNALFYDPLTDEVLDYVGGITDLEARLLRTVGKAEARFREDRLRMLRAVRFVGQLGFTLDAEARAAIERDHDELKLVSVERIFNEMRKLLESDHMITGLEHLLRSRLHSVFWPELSGFDAKRLQKFPKFLNWENAFAAVCILSNVMDPESRLKSWKVAKDSLRKVQSQIEFVRKLRTSSVRAERIRSLGSDVFAELVVLLSGLCEPAQVQAWVDEFMAVADQCGQLPQPFVNGADLIAAGVPPGPHMGQVLKQVYDAQLEGRVKSRDEALKLIKV